MLPSAADVADAAAALVVRASAAAIAADGRFTVALSGGRTPLPLFDRLADAHAGDIDWPRVHVFWADERCVPPDHEASNYGAARRHLLERVPVDVSHVHRIPGEMTPPVAAGVYRARLATFFRAEEPAGARAFDLVLLGLGEDGHVASIFPDSAALSSAEWALAVHAPRDVRPRWRVTLTAAAIGSAAQVAVIATGEAKADAVRAALEPGARGPAATLGADVRWLLDAAAGGHIAGS